MTKCKCVDWIILVCFLFIVVSCNESKRPLEIIVGGDDVVRILNFNNSADSIKKVNWYLKMSEVPDMSDTMIRHMKTVDDHKSVDNHTKILICSSNGGTLRMDHATRKCLFYAITPNEQPVEYLPGNRTAVALSTADKGNRLGYFCRHAERYLCINLKQL